MSDITWVILTASGIILMLIHDFIHGGSLGLF